MVGVSKSGPCLLSICTACISLSLECCKYTWSFIVVPCCLTCMTCINVKNPKPVHHTLIDDIVFLYVLVCIYMYVYLCYYTITNIADYSSSIQHVEPSDRVSEPLTKLKTCHTCGKRKQTKGNQMHVPNPWSNAWVVLNGSLSEAINKK